MKKLLSIFIMLCITTISFAQGIRFDANTVNVNENKEQTTITGVCHFAFDTEGYHMYYIDDELPAAGWDEAILSWELAAETNNRGKVLQIWSETAYIEIYYNHSRNGVGRPVILMLYPYIGMTEYCQYYWRPTTMKPVTSHN